MTTYTSRDDLGHLYCGIVELGSRCEVFGCKLPFEDHYTKEDTMRVRRVLEVEGDPAWVRSTLDRSLVSFPRPYFCPKGTIREVERTTLGPEYVIQVSFLQADGNLGRERYDFLDGLADEHGRFLYVGDRVTGISTKYGDREGIVVGVSEHRTQEDWRGPLSRITAAVVNGRRVGA